MNLESLKSVILSLLTSQEQAENWNKEANSDTSIFDGENIEEIIGDIFNSCDGDGDGELSEEEAQAISMKLSAYEGLSGIQITSLIEVDNKNPVLETQNNQEIDNTKLVNTKDNIDESIESQPEQIQGNNATNKTKLEMLEEQSTEAIQNDATITAEIKKAQLENNQQINLNKSRINELNEKIEDLSPEEVAELQKLEAEQQKLIKERDELEKEILKNCSDETKKAILEVQKERTRIALEESGEEVTEEVVENTITEQEAQATTPPQENAVTPPSNSSSGGNDYGSYNPTNTSPKPQSQNDNSGDNLENKSLEELNKLKGEKTGSIKTQQEELSGILNGTNSTLTGLKQNADTAFDAYKKLVETVSPELAEELNGLKTDKDNQQKLIDDQNNKINSAEFDFNNKTTAYNKATANFDNLNGIVSSLKSAASSAETSEEKNEINEKLKKAEAELETARTAKTNAENAKNLAETLLNDEKEKLTPLETDLATIETNLNGVQTKINELNNAEITTAQNNYNTAQKEYETQKDTMATTAKNNITTAQKELNDIEAAISVKECQEKKKEYNISKLPGSYKLGNVEYASLLDANELEKLSSNIQNGGAGNKWGHPDKCLSFAYSYGLWVDGSTNTPMNGKSAEYPDAGKYKKMYGSKDEILAEVKNQLDSGIPVVLQVNGNKAGTSRHYVTVVGYNKASGDKLSESDLLILDTYDGKIEGMGSNGARFMISGKDTGRTYDYQIYIRK